MNIKLLNHFLSDESGKGLTDYGAMLAFAALAISFVLGMKGAYQTTLANAFAPINN